MESLSKSITRYPLTADQKILNISILIVHVLSNYGIILSTPRERSESMPDKLPRKNAPTQEQWDWFEARLTHDVRKRLYNEAYRILQNRPDAEDVLEDSIRIGISNLSHLRCEERFFSWMFKIVRREAYHHLHRERRMKSVKLPLMLMRDAYDAGSTPDKLLITNEEREHLRQAIDQLKSPDREILLLKLKTSKNLKEIAAELGLNYHTTRSKFTRSCNLIKQKLDDEGGDGRHEKK